jgi:replicative DNA helicase
LVLGSQTVIAADTNVGKTGYALALMSATAASGVRCGFVSCEDPEDVVTPRMIAAFSSSLSSREIQIGKIHGYQVEDMDRAGIALRDRLGGRMMFSFAVGGTELDVCGAMSRMAAQGCRVICVDYVQAVEPSKKQQDRRNEIRWISARLKAHANRIGVALILVSQISRPPKGDESREPTKHDLKESGDLTNASEAIVLLWRNDESDGAVITCKLAKSKIGHVGATWNIQRDGNAKLTELKGSFRTPEQNQRERSESPQKKVYR